MSGYSRSAESMSRKTTPSFVHSSRRLWYTTSLSYCAPTPARYFFSASGMPRRSNVRLMSGDTSSHVFPWFSIGFM